MFKRHPILGVAVGIGGRFIMHFLSGVVFFGIYAPPGIHPAVYSAIYNGGYLGGEFIVSAILTYMMVKRGLITIYLEEKGGEQHTRSEGMAQAVLLLTIGSSVSQIVVSSMQASSMLTELGFTSIFSKVSISEAAKIQLTLYLTVSVLGAIAVILGGLTIRRGQPRLGGVASSLGIVFSLASLVYYGTSASHSHPSPLPEQYWR